MTTLRTKKSNDAFQFNLSGGRVIHVWGADVEAIEEIEEGLGTRIHMRSTACFDLDEGYPLVVEQIMGERPQNE